MRLHRGEALEPRGCRRRRRQPRSLTNEEVYALTAFILAQNKIIGASDVIDAQTLPKVRMPNREGFIPRFPERIP